MCVIRSPRGVGPAEGLGVAEGSKLYLFIYLACADPLQLWCPPCEKQDTVARMQQ